MYSHGQTSSERRLGMLTEYPYQATCDICKALLFSANDCYNANPYTNGWCCQQCYNEKVRTMKTYRIIRYYAKPTKQNKVIATGLTLQQAQEWCSRDDTRGEGWFDGYTKD
jgi:hypothetical protein